MKTCPHCQQPLTVIPAGVSKKTGRSYKEFHKCEKCGIIINDGGPRTEPKPAYQGSNNEIMNALREVYKLLESVSKRIDVLMLDSNPGDYEKLSKRIGTITDDSDLRIVSKKELDEIFPTE